jgi:tRNA dimethylallyltransferase
MLTDGLIEEVRGLMQRPELHADLPSMRCVGYRQTWEALESGNLEGLADRCIAATRQLAKRQITWLRSMPARQTLACDDAHMPQRAIDWARQQLHSLGFSST